MSTTKLSLFLVLVAALAFSLIASAQSVSSTQTLEGAWNVSVQFADPGPPCAPAGIVVTSIGPGYGTVIAESCYASEGAGYGSWLRTGPNQFSITFIGNSFDDSTGLVASTYKVQARVSLGPTKNTFSGPFTTTFFDLNGTPLGPPVTGTVSGVRIEVEP